MGNRIMEKLYTDKQYSDMAVEATNCNKQLYVYVHPLEYEVEVLEWNKKIIEVQKYDPETGEPMYDEEGNPIMEEIEVDDYDNPIMVEETIIDPETGEEKTILVQKHHTELRTKEVGELLIECYNYYICFKDNFTYKEINPNYEEQEAQKEKVRIGNLKCTKRVFVLLLEELQLDYFEEILPIIEANRQAKLEWDLCVELQRSNPLLDRLAEGFGITSHQLDNLFKYANGEISLTEFKS